MLYFRLISPNKTSCHPPAAFHDRREASQSLGMPLIVHHTSPRKSITYVLTEYDR